jgi:hypothetical protein
MMIKIFPQVDKKLLELKKVEAIKKYSIMMSQLKV